MAPTAENDGPVWCDRCRRYVGPVHFGEDEHTAENDAPVFRCVTCGEPARYFTSLEGQAQTFYCEDHRPVGRIIPPDMG